MALKENIRVEGRRDIQTKVMITLFALFADVERDLIPSVLARASPGPSPRAGSSAARRGSLGVSRLDMRRMNSVAVSVMIFLRDAPYRR